MALRLSQLRLSPWGCFADQEIDFGPPGAVDLVRGPNAAGKSTLARAILALVFGIDQRSVDAHTHAYPDLRIGAKLELGDEVLDVVRRKGRVGTLATPDGQALTDDLFASGLGGLGKAVFDSLLMIDNAGLKEGAAELLQGRGEVGASLFAAAAGLASLHQTVERFDAEAKQAFNPGGRKDPVHVALRDLRAAEKRQHEGTLRPRRQREMERELERLDMEAEELRRAMAEFEAEAHVLRRHRLVAPLLARHRELCEALEKLSDVPELPEDARAVRVSAETRRQSAQRRRTRARENADGLTLQLKELAVDEALLARADEVRAKREEVPVIAKAAADRPRRERTLAEAEERLRVAATTAGIDEDDIERLRRPEPARRRLDDAIRIHGQLVERRRAAAEAHAKAEQQLAGAEKRLAEAAEPEDVSALSAAIDAVLAAGGIETQAREARAETERLEAEAEARLKRLSPGPATLEALQSTPVPGEDAVAAAVFAAGELREAERDLANEQDRLAGDREQLREQRDQLELGARVPTASDLLRSRTDRDRAWAELRPALEGKVNVEPAVAGEYELRVAEADSTADAQVAGTARLAEAAAIEAAERKLARQAEALAVREVELAGRRRDLADGWEALWTAAGFEAPELATASAWLEQRERTLTVCSEASRHEARARALSDEIDSHAASLTSRLTEHGVEAPSDARLAELRALAEQVVERSTAAARIHETLARELAEARSAAAGAESEEAAAAEASEQWQAKWPQVLEATGLPAETTPESALEVARAVGDGLQELATISGQRRSVDGIDRDRRGFEAGVAELCSALAPDLEGLAPEAGIAALADRLDVAEKAATERDNLLDQQAKLEAELREADGELAQADDELEELRLAAGCEDIAQLPRVETEASRACEFRRELAELEGRAVDAGEDRFDRLVAELSEFDPAAASARESQIAEELEELAGRRDEVKTTLGERRAELRAAESNVSAVDAAEDAELAKAELELAARAHARAKLAAIVMRRAMDRYRRLHENPLLARANTLFARFTLGSFVELFVDHDEDAGAILVGRQRDRKPKRVEAMSSGTREQLFLALRIAAIERYVATAGAVPVIFDDAFLESDEKRSAEIFKALAELASVTQVIVLTHQEHLAHLGKQVLSERLSVVELPDAAPVLRAAGEAAAA